MLTTTSYDHPHLPSRPSLEFYHFNRNQPAALDGAGAPSLTSHHKDDAAGCVPHTMLCCHSLRCAMTMMMMIRLRLRLRLYGLLNLMCVRVTVSCCSSSVVRHALIRCVCILRMCDTSPACLCSVHV